MSDVRGDHRYQEEYEKAAGITRVCCVVLSGAALI
jgi:hypothetical protein